MAFALIALIAAGYFSSKALAILAGAFLILAMSFPMAFKYPASLWLGLSHILGSFMSRVLLSVVFISVVLPVGFIRRLMGKDPLMLNNFKHGTGSVLKKIDKTYTPEDLEDPY